MKKLLFIVCMLFAFSNVNAQTKEETIAWIKEKLEKYTHYSSIQISECEIILSYKQQSEGLSYWEYKYTIPLKNIDTLKIGLLRSKLNNFKYDSKYFNGTQNKYEDEKSEQRSMVTLVDFDKYETNLNERFLKAIKHLTSFCWKEEKKETF